MKKISVKSIRGNYDILVGQGLLAKSGSFLKRLGFKGKVMVISQENIAAIYFESLRRSLKKSGFSVSLHLLPQGEEAKSEKELFRLYHALIDQDFERKDGLFALGGGVVGDLTGFAAASYLRGIPFVNAGTTLLAQVDSSIGGKTGINLAEGKNLVGAFNPPRAVLSDAGVLRTLPERELEASLAEVVKYGVISDPSLFSLLEKNSYKILAKNKTLLSKIVESSSKIKAGVVTRDEFETKGERAILNFGHTFGHAFEKALDYKKLMHGEAVAVGMVCAAKLAVQLEYAKPIVEQRITRLLKDFHLPVSIASFGLSADEILEAMQRDKKKHAGRLRFVLPKKIGSVCVCEDIPASKVREILYEVGAK